MTDREIMEALLAGERITCCKGESLAYLDQAGVLVGALIAGPFHRAPNWRIKPKPRLTWDQALRAMREGKKVRREVWLAGSFLFIRDGVFRRKVAQQGLDYAVFAVSDFDATDFEVVE